MNGVSLQEQATELLAKAQEANSGRAAHTVYGGAGHLLRQTVIAMLAGQELAEHDSPGEATLQVLQGRVVLRSQADSREGAVGDLLIIPPQRHSLEAVEDCVVVLTVVAR